MRSAEVRGGRAGRGGGGPQGGPWGTWAGRPVIRALSPPPRKQPQTVPAGYPKGPLPARSILGTSQAEPASIRYQPQKLPRNHEELMNRTWFSQFWSILLCLWRRPLNWSVPRLNRATTAAPSRSNRRSRPSIACGCTAGARIKSQAAQQRRQNQKSRSINKAPRGTATGTHTKTRCRGAAQRRRRGRGRQVRCPCDESRVLVPVLVPGLTHVLERRRQVVHLGRHRRVRVCGTARRAVRAWQRLTSDIVRQHQH